ncbi:MAG: CRISPR-associated CARF protein Csa3 [Nitrososphaerota archaeon]|nr:CRISPR-associated CARF protein Csa3 [Nitrososphaerota archaeon]
MMKTFIATIGWTEWPIASAIIKHGLSKGDMILLLSPEKRDERSREAISEVKGFVSKFAQGVEVTDIPIPVHDPVESVVILAKMMKEEAEKGRKLIVNLSGGMRILVIEVLLALTLLKIDNLDLEIRTEDKVDMSIPRLWKCYPELTREEVMVLETLFKGGEASLSEISRRIRASIATVHRVLKRMEKDGLISSKKSGKEKLVVLTSKGKVLYRLFCEKS